MILRGYFPKDYFILVLLRLRLNLEHLCLEVNNLGWLKSLNTAKTGGGPT